jgi:hypothetical protein
VVFGATPLDIFKERRFPLLGLCFPLHLGKVVRIGYAVGVIYSSIVYGMGRDRIYMKVCISGNIHDLIHGLD